MPRWPAGRSRRADPGAAAQALIAETVQRGFISAEVVERARAGPQITLTALVESCGQAALDHLDDALASQLYLVALELGSHNSAVAYNLGNIAGRAGRSLEAVEHYSHAIDMDPGFAMAYYNRGVHRRRSGDETGARGDISAAIDHGYDNVMAFAALLRGRSDEFGAPADAFEQASWVAQLLISGDADMAMITASADSAPRRDSPGRDPRDRLALAIALDAEWRALQATSDLHGAIRTGEDLIAVSEDVADADAGSWDGNDTWARRFVAGQLPQRLIRMIRLYSLAGRHADALDAAARATDRCGGQGSLHPAMPELYTTLAAAVMLEMHRRALAMAGDPGG